MKLTVAAIGKLKTRHFADAAGDYEKRLRRYASVDVHELKGVRGRARTDIQARESAALRGVVPKGSRVVVLDERGALVSSTALANKLADAATHGDGAWSFLVGGAEGHANELRREADWVWSLSPLTLPHELARVVLMEQLYRAMTIIRGESYHREG